MNTKENALRLRDLRINPPLLLAPMAGLTHSALRQTISGFGGVGLLSTEMLSAKRLPTENREISPFLITTPDERPLSYQLLISKVEEAGPAIERLHELQADAIDLNLGCPAPAVRKFGAGSKLAEQPDTVRRIVATTRKHTDLPLTAKIRLGNELNEQDLKAFCTMLEDEGIDMLSVHARLKREPFTRKPKWQWCARIKQWLTIPVIANGGIFSVRDAEKCLRVSGADGLMIGRGAAVRPWLLAEIARKLFKCDIEEREVLLPEVYINFIYLLNTHFPPERRLGRLKEFTHYFSQNFKFGHHLASKVQSSRSIAEAQQRAELFFLNSQ